MHCLLTGLLFSFGFSLVTAQGACCGSANERVQNDLKCYQCTVEDNSLCTEKEHLLTCPSDQAYDMCMTNIKKTPTDGFVIVKRCVLGPCDLRDSSASDTLSLDHCDRSKEDFDCVMCCKGDGCNVAGAPSLLPSTFLFLLPIFLFYINRIYKDI